jgi:hypothetical protein
VSKADKIRKHGREKYVLPARTKKQRRFSIRTGDVVRELRLHGRVNSACSALKSRTFLEQNGLRLVERSGPSSGQSTTVTYLYEFLDTPESSAMNVDPWTELRGALKQVYAELGGGESYLRGERENFYASEEKS